MKKVESNKSRVLFFCDNHSQHVLGDQSVSGGTFTVNTNGERIYKKAGICRVLAFFMSIAKAFMGYWSVGVKVKTVPQSVEEYLSNKALTQIRAAKQLLIAAFILFIIFLISCYQLLELNGKSY